jgi:ribosomal protein S18 acetylase RimI-like enzyme
MRTATMADLPAVTELYQAIDLAEIGRVETGEADIRQILGASEVRSRLFESEGRALGFAALHPAPHADQLRAHLGAAPDAPGELAGTLLRWIEDRAARRIAVAGRDHQFVTLHQWPDAVAAPALRRHGWTVVRRYSRLIADLTGERPASPDLPAGTRIRVPASEHDRRRLHAVLEEAEAGHWNHHRRTFEEFWADQRRRAGHDPDLWWLAEVGATPAAVLIARAEPDRGWIAWLGTERRFRGRGLARSLLRTAFAALRERGLPMVGVDVDSANETSALGVYQAVGMRVLGESDQWRRDF